MTFCATAMRMLQQEWSLRSLSLLRSGRLKADYDKDCELGWSRIVYMERLACLYSMWIYGTL